MVVPFFGSLARAIKKKKRPGGKRQSGLEGLRLEKGA